LMLTPPACQVPLRSGLPSAVRGMGLGFGGNLLAALAAAPCWYWALAGIVAMAAKNAAALVAIKRNLMPDLPY